MTVAHRHFTHLDVPVLRELVPHHLHRAADHVRLVGRLALRRALGAPPPLRSHAAQHARLRRPDRRRADRVRRLGRVPQVGEHVHAPALELCRLRVLVLVDHVLVDRKVHQRVHLRFLPRLAEGREVLARVPVEEQLVGDDLVHRVGIGLGRREPVLRQRARDVVAGEKGLAQFLADELTLVERHSRSLACDPGAGIPRQG